MYDDIETQVMAIHLTADFESGEGEVSCLEHFNSANPFIRKDLILDWLIALEVMYQDVESEIFGGIAPGECEVIDLKSERAKREDLDD
tara:strand:+ start:1242 stop:1505 length:264 start_codon:yes stop_codon:yes gene_type:complete